MFQPQIYHEHSVCLELFFCIVAFWTFDEKYEGLFVHHQMKKENK